MTLSFCHFVMSLSIANFCAFAKIKQWTFPETLIGLAAYSLEECPPHTASGMEASQLQYLNSSQKENV